MKRRSSPVSVRLTVDQRARAEQHAARKQVSLSTLAKEGLLGASIKGTRAPRVDAQAVGKLLAEMAKVRAAIEAAPDTELTLAGLTLLLELRTACLEALGVG